MQNFEPWFTELKSDERWYELLRAYRDETINKAAEKVYAQLVADGDDRPMSANRKHVYNILCAKPGDKPAPKPWYLKEEERKALEEEKEWKPASPEHVDKCVAMLDEMMRNSSMINAYPRIGYKQSIEEGGWLPKKEAPYPVTSLEEAYIKMRHIEYVKQNYEPRTGAKLPGWISEEEFNYQFDNDLI